MLSFPSTTKIRTTWGTNASLRISFGSSNTARNGQRVLRSICTRLTREALRNLVAALPPTDSFAISCRLLPGRLPGTLRLTSSTTQLWILL
jgi:hypothetical protein